MDSAEQIHRSEKLYKIAINDMDLRVVQLLRESGHPMTPSVFEAATASGNMEIIRFVNEHDCPWDKNVYRGPIVNDDREVLDYLHEHIDDDEGWACDIAIEYGKLDLLKMFRQRRYPLSESAHDFLTNLIDPSR